MYSQRAGSSADLLFVCVFTIKSMNYDYYVLDHLSQKFKPFPFTNRVGEFILSESLGEVKVSLGWDSTHCWSE